jgi:hypothetical protein
MSKKQNDRATHVDVIEVHEALKSLIEIIETGPDGKGTLCRYKGNDDDHTVAERLKVSSATVSSIRRQRYGNLRAAAEPGAVDSAEIAALKATANGLTSISNRQDQQIAALQTAVKQLRDENALLWLRTDLIVTQYNRAIDNLALNRALPGNSGLKVKQRAAPPLMQAAE